MKNVYIIFSYTGTYFSTFLSFMSGERYIHVSIAFDEKLKEVYSFGRKNPKWALPSGFVMEDMKKLTNYFKKAVCKIYVLPLTKKQYQQLRKELKKYQDKQNEYRYNIKGLIPIHFNKVYHRKYHFVCSQFVGKILEDSNIYEFNKDYSLIRPKDIINIPDLTFMYEGKIIDYLRNLEYEKAI